MTLPEATNTIKELERLATHILETMGFKFADSGILNSFMFRDCFIKDTIRIYITLPHGDFMRAVNIYLGYTPGSNTELLIRHNIAITVNLLNPKVEELLISSFKYLLKCG